MVECIFKIKIKIMTLPALISH